ncbi:MAG: glycosyltransferase family 2 protein [Chloroflexi bacterium]|nr:glycosyltransferase family 2 protein [Chloroflexota bacterium]
MNVSILIPTYNTVDWLENCLGAVFGEEIPDSEVVVFDNASTDGSSELVAQRFPQARLLCARPNIGYVRAVNTLLENSHGKYLILLDSDTTPEQGSLRHLVAMLEADSQLGAIGPRLIGIDGQLQRWTAGHLPTFSSVSAFYLGLDRIAAHFGVDYGLFLARDLRKPKMVQWLCSCCLALHRNAIVAAGLMDEAYFSYLGDLDLCRRIAEQGWAVQYDPRVTVLHAQGRNTAREPGYTSPDTISGLDHYLATHCSAATCKALRRVEALGYAARSFAYRGLAFAKHSPRADRMATMHWNWLRQRCATRTVRTEN